MLLICAPSKLANSFFDSSSMIRILLSYHEDQASRVGHAGDISVIQIETIIGKIKNENRKSKWIKVLVPVVIEIPGRSSYGEFLDSF